MSRATTGAAVLAALVACAGTNASAQSTVDSGTLLAELERLTAAVAATPHEDLPPLAATIPTVWTVRHEGQQFEVPAGWIRRALEDGRKEPASWPTRRDALVTRLEATHREMRSLIDDSSRPDIDRSRAVAGGVLARKEFRRSVSDSAIAQLRRQITEWLLSIWDRVGGNRLGTRRATVAVAWIAALSALAALSWWLVATLLRTGDRTGLSLVPPVPRRRSARAWARQAARSEDPREVVRCAYRATVVSLEEEGAWRADDARTPREHLRLLAAEHRRRPIFADVARRFEEVWFGAKTPTADDTRILLARLKELGCLHGD